MAGALISVLLEQLTSVVYEDTNEAVKLDLDADKEIVDSVSGNLIAIQAVLEDAEIKQLTDPRVGEWLKELKDVLNEMDDVLYGWNAEILRKQVEKQEEERDHVLVTKKKVSIPMPADCFCFGQVNKDIHTIARSIRELNVKLNLIAGKREKHCFHQGHVHQSTERGPDYQQLIPRQRTSSLLDISMIFGREEEKNTLLGKLLRESSPKGERFLIIPIVGMGGVGKTTLAQLAYNDRNVTTHFDNKVWICVSDPFEEIKIAKAIFESLARTESSSNDLELILQGIRKYVENNKLLLVLDDVWTEDKTKWENLKLPIIMQSCAEGSAILVTTRKQEVAKIMRATSSMIHLDKLSDRGCLELFNRIAFLNREEDKDSGFEAIGEKIVSKCKGLPLAANTLGNLMWDKKARAEWSDVLNGNIWELKEVKQQVFSSLLLSYYDLALAVKKCFLYCAIFPKNYELTKDNLIEVWMSQDYLNSEEKIEKRIIGQNYFEILAMRSFFQDFDRDEMGNIIRCKMHDIMYEFVQFLTQKECTIIKAGVGANQRVELPGDKVRHLTLTSLPEAPLSFLTPPDGCKNMRTLTLLDSSITAISPCSILLMKCLRTLNLRDNKLNEVPKEIGQLRHLRYMNLSRNDALKELPDAVCDLYNLQTLVLSSCSELKKLPKAMGKLISLKHLYLRGCDELRYLPKGIGSLKSLQVLDGFYVCEGDDDEALKLGDLGIMDELQGSLWIERLAKDDASEIVKAQLGNKEHLSHLGVSFQDGDEDAGQRKGDDEIVKALQPHQNLEHLSIWNCHGTTESLNWILFLPKLREVYLCDWQYCEALPPLGKLPSLEILEIQWMDNVKKVEFLGTEKEILFPKLERLSFRFMHYWEEWEGIINVSSEITIMPMLSSLQIWYCPELKALPDFLYKIKALRTLTIGHCSILKGEYEKDVGKEWHNISHIPNLTIVS